MNPVHMIISVKIGDPAGRAPYDRYIREVKPVVESFGGKYIVRSERITASGGWAPDRVIVIEFPSRARLDECFSSEEYNSIKALRENTVVAESVIVE
ncbi:MAG: DUF1330 domain-containing protein [Firmicutes bacterium]|nr:DUF1330 domain-containing protein [Bacillota bacterium]